MMLNYVINWSLQMISLDWIKFVSYLPMDYWFCDGVLFIKNSLSDEDILKIIKDYINLEREPMNCLID